MTTRNPLSPCRSGRPAALLLIAAVLLAGCGGEDAPAPVSSAAAATVPDQGPGTQPSVSVNTPPAPAPAPEPAPAPAPGPTDPVSQQDPDTSPDAGNQAPVIGGSPTTSLNAATSYTFMPTASDADGDALGFTIANKPAWANFSTATGALAGTPTQADVGTWSGILITVSDGQASATLGAFSITVTQVANGVATLSWMPPTLNTDGSALTNLSGYRIYYGTSAGALDRTIDLANASLSTYVVDDLSPATWYFAIKAIAGGVESDFSNVASKTIS